MRKLFWGCAFASAMLAFGSYTAASYAVKHPTSFLGRALHGASHVAACINPYKGFSPVVKRMQSAGSVHKEEVCVESEGVPAEPQPCMPPCTDKPTAPAIVIAEQEAPQAAPVNSTDIIELPATVAAAPENMPLCEDLVELPMPTLAEEEEEEEQESPTPAQNWAARLMSWFRCETQENPKPVAETPEPPMPQETPACPSEGSMVPVCPRHHGGCPYTGGGCYRPNYPPIRQDQSGGEEASEEGISPALQKIRRIKNRANIDLDRCPTHPGVDTMEYRSSDRKLHEYGPGPL